MTDTQPPQRLRTSLPAAVLQRPTSRLVWPIGGYPAVFDEVATTLYDCFEEPVSVDELAIDLVDALNMDMGTAVTTLFGFTTALLSSGHLIPEGMNPMPVSHLSYPPSASP